MAFNGSGTFNRTNGTNSGATTWAQDAAAGTKILSTRHDSHDEDLANGLSNCITKDGQTTVTADLPMATFKHTGVGEADAQNQYPSVGQIQDGEFIWGGDATGDANDMLVTLSPAITAYVDGMTIGFRAAFDFAEASASTLDVNSVGATNVKKLTATGTINNINAGDILEKQHCIVQYNSGGGGRWILMNPLIPTFSTIKVLDPTVNQIAKIDSSGFLTSQDAADTRSDISAAASGANTDITSITGLTTDTWTPTLTASGSMTATGETVHEARYQDLGEFIEFYMVVSFTIGGTPDTQVQFTVPVAADNHAALCSFPCTAVDGGGTLINTGFWRIASGKIIVFPSGAANWSTGANAAVHIQGKYKAT